MAYSNQQPTTVVLPNGARIEVGCDLSLEQIINTITASGVANLSGARATERNVGGAREVAFSEPAGTRKGI